MLAVPVANASTHPGKKPVLMQKFHPPAPTFTERVTGLAAKFPNAYGGLEVSLSGHTIVYVVASKGSAFLKALRSEASHYPGQHYTVVDVRHSWAQLEDLTSNKITQDEPGWRAKGIRLARWGPEPATNKVLIQLRDPSARATQALVAAYGAEWVTVSPEPFTEKLVFKDRYHDYAPFYGGDAIAPCPSSGWACTDAFIMFNN
jgi:hypothetical protein